jgi:uncharacterized protein DUF3291
MAIVSVTRLHLRSLRFLPAFGWRTWFITRQTRAAPGFIRGRFANEWPYAFWTMTVWQNLAAMHAFRDSGAHHPAMRKLLHWCDEASFVHWDDVDGVLPAVTDAHARLLSGGRTSKVSHPSAAHRAGQRATSRVPVAGPMINPDQSG